LSVCPSQVLALIAWLLSFSDLTGSCSAVSVCLFPCILTDSCNSQPYVYPLPSPWGSFLCLPWWVALLVVSCP
jgi:hypothetical protein